MEAWKTSSCRSWKAWSNTSGKQKLVVYQRSFKAWSILRVKNILPKYAIDNYHSGFVDISNKIFNFNIYSLSAEVGWRWWWLSFSPPEVLNLSWLGRWPIWTNRSLQYIVANAIVIILIIAIVTIAMIFIIFLADSAKPWSSCRRKPSAGVGKYKPGAGKHWRKLKLC